MIPRHSLSATLCALLIALLCASASARAQSESDFKTMDKARSLYLTGPIPGSISCNAAIDWDAFFTRLNIDRTDAIKARIEKLKAMQVTVTSRGEEDTEVKVVGGDTIANSQSISDGLRQQLRGFFQMYWAEAYGRLLAKRGDKFQLTTLPDGYIVKAAAGPMSTSVQMDASYLITSFGIASPQLNAVVKPTFKPGDDGLLRLRDIDETVDFGQSKIVISVSLDYQKIGAYDIPQHLNMSVPGSYSFDYTLSGCQVTETPATPKNK